MKNEDYVENGVFTINESQGTPAIKTFGSSPYIYYFPYFSNVIAKQWELGGSENSDLITTKSTSYTYDNYGNATTIAQSITDNDPASPYSGDSWTTTTTNTPDVSTSPWCVHLLTQTQISYTASVGSSVTRTKQFSPDLANCRYTQVVTEPTSSTYKVTESLAYDGFGNLNTDTVTGVGMSPRTTTISWVSSSATTGQLPLSVTDASGAVTQFTYNYSFGLPATQIDPNSLTTSWLYGDGFGRWTRENHPDGTYTTRSYTLCSGCDPLPRMEITEQSTAATGAAIATKMDYFDMVDRPLYHLRFLPSGATIWAQIHTYDSLGRLASDYFPYLTSGPSYGSTSYTYDALNRPTQVQRPISSTDSTLQTTSYAYAGRTTTQTDPRGGSAS